MIPTNDNTWTPDAYTEAVQRQIATIKAILDKTPNRPATDNPHVAEPEPEYLGPVECDLRADGERAARMGWTR